MYHFIMDLLKTFGPILDDGPSDNYSCASSKRRLQRMTVYTLDYRWNPGPTEKVS